MIFNIPQKNQTTSLTRSFHLDLIFPSGKACFGAITSSKELSVTRHRSACLIYKIIQPVFLFFFHAGAKILFNLGLIFAKTFRISAALTSLHFVLYCFHCRRTSRITTSTLLFGEWVHFSHLKTAASTSTSDYVSYHTSSLGERLVNNYVW